MSGSVLGDQCGRAKTARLGIGKKRSDPFLVDTSEEVRSLGIGSNDVLSEIAWVL